MRLYNSRRLQGMTCKTCGGVESSLSCTHHEGNVVLLEVRDVVSRGQRSVAFPCHFRTTVRPSECQEFPVDQPVQVAIFDLTAAGR